MRKMRPRVIPVLLLRGEGLVKTQGFDQAKYLGDPINAVKIFNDSEVDEIILLDISVGEKGPQMARLAEIISEAFMPLCYGGGVREFSQVEELFTMGVEKVAFNTAAFTTPQLLTQASQVYGSQSIVASMDVKKNFWGKYEVVVENAQRSTKTSPVEYAKKMQEIGAGEIFLNSVDRDGQQGGYDLGLVQMVSSAVSIPVVACGGARELTDCQKVVKAGASAAAAGSLFVFHGKLRGVLINYPTQQQLRELFQ